AAVPLEPAAWIVRMDPAFAPPFRQRLAGVDAEEIERAIAVAAREPGAREPTLGKLAPAVGHVLAAEHAEANHLGRRQLGLEVRIEIAAGGSHTHIAVALLHLVLNGNRAARHCVYGPQRLIACVHRLTANSSKYWCSAQR